MAALPGVTRATLNATAGKLALEGRVDLAAIQAEGNTEGYRITLAGEARAEPTRPGPDWPLLRTIASGLAFGLGILAERMVVADWLPIGLFAVAIAAGGWGNAKRAYYSLPRLDFNMSVLMTVAVAGAVIIGEWEEGAAVAFLYSVSELLQARTLERSRRSIRQLMDLAPRTVRLLRPDGEVEVPVEAVAVGDTVVIRPGEKLALDGRIVRGQSALDEAAITGESVPAEKGPGAEVFAGTLNTYGALEVSVTRQVADTTLARIVHMVEEAQGRRAPSQAFVDRFAAVYTPIVLALAAGVVIVPPLFLGQPWEPWVYRGLALLVVSCPCALVVSTPVAIVSAISNAARKGVLIKGGLYLEQLGAVAAVAFDKTGTLTRGRPAVHEVVPLDGLSADELLRLAAGVEARSEHPLAQAVVRAAEEKGLAVEPAADFTALPGRGARAQSVAGLLYVGSPRLFGELGHRPEAATDVLSRLEATGMTAMLVGTSERLLGVIAVADEVRPVSRTALARLKQAGIQHTIMLTGDNPATARAIAERVGVDEYRAELLPQDKVSAVEALLGRYGKVAMVGDGVNDAPALAAASVGIAMGGAGTDTALETADVALMADDLARLPFAVRLSRETLAVIRQNIAFSLAIKALAVALVFPGWLTLWLAVLADMGASIIVTLNGVRLYRVNPQGDNSATHEEERGSR